MHRVQYKKNSYAGKVICSKILAEYPQFANESVSELQNHLAIKCNSWAGNLYHPNIEMFFEVVHSSAVDIPMILTELLTESLTVFVKRTKETIHVSKELSLCNDMAQGMAYIYIYTPTHWYTEISMVIMCSYQVRGMLRLLIISVRCYLVMLLWATHQVILIIDYYYLIFGIGPQRINILHQNCFKMKQLPLKNQIFLHWDYCFFKLLQNVYLNLEQVTPM